VPEFDGIMTACRSSPVGTFSSASDVTGRPTSGSLAALVRSPTLPSPESLGLVPMVKNQRVAIRIANDRLVAEARVEHRATGEVRA
jgi:hypothetical protein